MAYLSLKFGDVQAESKEVMHDNIAKQVDILISKNQALQILYLRHIKLHKLATMDRTHENLIPTNDTVQFYCYITIVNKTYLIIGQLNRFSIGSSAGS